MFDILKSADKELFLFLNGMHNSFFDFIMYWASNRFVWIPFYLLLLLVIIKQFGRRTYFILLLIAGMITLSDQMSSTIVKNSVQRLRPCHDPEIQPKVHLVYGICGGQYGYFSSHASNSCALAVFLILLFRRPVRNKETGTIEKHVHPLISIALVVYALLVSYSRIYLGIHYPFDVFSGVIFGLVLSFIFAQLFFRYSKTIS